MWPSSLKAICAEHTKLCNRMAKRTERFPPINIITSDDAVVEAQFITFLLHAIVIFHLEILIFLVLNHSFSYENCDVRISISTRGRTHLKYISVKS